VRQTCFRARDLPPGTHILKAVKVSGNYMSVDHVRVYSGGDRAAVLNNTATALTYAGTSWTYLSGRGLGEYQDDLDATTSNGDSYSVAFVGTGADLISDRDTNRGPFDVYVDGVFSRQVSAYGSLAIRATLFSVRDLALGSHTITAYKRGGTYMDIDAVNVYSALNDTSPAFGYQGSGGGSGSWTHQGGRGLGEYEDDLHYTTANGDFYTLSFTGTGVDILGDRDANRGLIDFYVDGLRPIRVDASGAVAAQQLIFRMVGLGQGSHTLKAVKVSGTFMDVDRARVHGQATINDTDSSIAYYGSWGLSSGRPFGDYQGDVHYTQHAGDSFDLPFWGTGVEFITEMDPSQGILDVRVDGVPRGQAFTRGATRTPQTTVFRLHGLAPGLHHLTAAMHVGDNAMYGVVDAFKTLY
jgi:hypothetical protein